MPNTPTTRGPAQKRGPVNVLLNADLGEGFAHDREIMPLLDLANIACGAHAGSDALMQQTIAQALEHEVQISAHPGYPDRENFGRLSMPMSATAFNAMLLPQLARMRDALELHGQQLRYVKPHGALYNDCANSAKLSERFVRLCLEFDSGIAIIGLAGSHLIDRAAAAGAQFYAEGFCDRRYLANGRLAPRTSSGACIDNIEQATQQAMQLVDHGTVTCLDGTILAVEVNTLCVHGDSPAALSLARSISQQLNDRRQHAGN